MSYLTPRWLLRPIIHCTQYKELLETGTLFYSRWPLYVHPSLLLPPLLRTGCCCTWGRHTPYAQHATVLLQSGRLILHILMLPVGHASPVRRSEQLLVLRWYPVVRPVRIPASTLSTYWAYITMPHTWERETLVMHPYWDQENIEPTFGYRLERLCTINMISSVTLLAIEHLLLVVLLLAALASLAVNALPPVLECSLRHFRRHFYARWMSCGWKGDID